VASRWERGTKTAGSPDILPFVCAFIESKQKKAGRMQVSLKAKKPLKEWFQFPHPRNTPYELSIWIRMARSAREFSINGKAT